jgi:uncharacterized protein
MVDRIGTVTEGSLTKGLTARLDSARTVEDVRVGYFVKIQGTQYDYFCLITDVTLSASAPGVLADPPGPEEQFLRDVLAGTATFGSVQIQPMLMLAKEIDDPSELGLLGQPQPVRTIPPHFAPVDKATDQDFNRVFAEPGETTCEIGAPLDMEGIPVRLDLKRIAERSNGVFGKSGTGKSMLTRILLCGLIKSNCAVNLIFDMHDEYAWTTPAQDNRPQLKGLKDLFSSRVAVYTLKSSRPISRSRRSDGDIVIGLNEIEVDDIALLADLLNLNDTAIETIYLLQEDLGEMWLARLLEMTQTDIHDLAERTGAHPSSVAALKRKLNQLLQLDFITRERIPPGSSSIDSLIKSLSDGANVVLAFEHESQLLPYMLVANVITRRIHKRWTDDTNQANAGDAPQPRPLMITIEEAHKFLSPTAARHTSFGNIARELRKFNVTLLVVDQRPSGIDPEVLSQIGTRFTCQLNDETDIAAILAGVSGATHLRSVLASLDSQQQAMLLGHAVPMPVVVKVRTIDDAFYEDVTAGRGGAVFPTGTRLTSMLNGDD